MSNDTPKVIINQDKSVLNTLLNNNLSYMKDDLRERLGALIQTAFDLGVRRGKAEAEALQDALRKSHEN